MTDQVKKKIDFSGVKKLFAPILNLVNWLWSLSFRSKASERSLVKSRFLNRIVVAKKVVVDFVVPIKFRVAGNNSISYDVIAESCELLGGVGKKYLLYTSKNNEPITLEIYEGDVREAVKKGHLIVKSFVV